MLENILSFVLAFVKVKKKVGHCDAGINLDLMMMPFTLTSRTYVWCED